MILLLITLAHALDQGAMKTALWAYNVYSKNSSAISRWRDSTAPNPCAGYTDNAGASCSSASVGPSTVPGSHAIGSGCAYIPSAAQGNGRYEASGYCQTAAKVIINTPARAYPGTGGAIPQSSCAQGTPMGSPSCFY
jgi:hypothetical protein